MSRVLPSAAQDSAWQVVMPRKRQPAVNKQLVRDLISDVEEALKDLA